MTLLSPESFATFGDLLRYLRQREHLTQRELSIAVGYSESQINRLEKNLRLPEASIIAAQFIPALHLDDEPEIAARLIELAAQARGEPVPTSLAFRQSARLGAVEAKPVRPRERRTNLPAQMTSFIGRESEIAELTARVTTTRLLTLIGAGGCGKTRLALEVASRVAADFPDGAWLAEFASLSDESLVPHALANVFGLLEQPNATPTDVLMNYLASKHMLIVFDNCEHLIEACARLADRLLRDCPCVHLLATSREPLRIAGEMTWRVPSLSVPESIRLFTERARAVRPDFDPADQAATTVTHICQQLDGIPLAIELAVARVNSLSVEQRCSSR